MSDYHKPRPSWRKRIVVGGTIVASVLGAAFLWGSVLSPATSTKPVAEVASVTVPQDHNANQQPDASGWQLIYYSKQSGLPKDFFGYGCDPKGSGSNCLANQEDRMKHDPMLLSTWMVNLKLLPGVTPEMWQNATNPKIEAQIEADREQWQNKLTDTDTRKLWQQKVCDVLNGIQGLHIVPLQGDYYTTSVGNTGQVYQADVNMNPSENVAIEGTLPEVAATPIATTQFESKLDCGGQVVSRTPIPGVPIQPTPTPTPTVTPTPPPSVSPSPTPTPSESPYPTPSPTPTPPQHHHKHHQPPKNSCQPSGYNNNSNGNQNGKGNQGDKQGKQNGDNNGKGSDGKQGNNNQCCCPPPPKQCDNSGSNQWSTNQGKDDQGKDNKPSDQKSDNGKGNNNTQCTCPQQPPKGDNGNGKGDNNQGNSWPSPSPSPWQSPQLDNGDQVLTIPSPTPSVTPDPSNTNNQ